MIAHDSKCRSEAPSLAGAEWLKRRETSAVFGALQGDSIETRAVGGAVRNALLGLPVTEIDLATTAEPERVIALAEEAGLKAVPTGIDHGTVTVIADGLPFEVTTLRRDVETFGRHAKIAYTTSWEEDAKRRDFTLNALYADRDGKVFDPLGGYDDLAAGRVRFIGDAEARIKEDFLRILRFFRFHAYYGKGDMDAAGPQGCGEAARRDRAALGRADRRRAAAYPRGTPSHARGRGALRLRPAHRRAWRRAASRPVRKLVAIEAANRLAPDASLRLAALAVFVEEDVARLAERLRLSNAEQAVLALGAEKGVAGLPEETAAKSALYRLGPSYRSAMLLAWVDSGASPDDAEWRKALALPERWQVPSFPIGGNDVMALGELKGPEIGELLKVLEQDWIASGFALGRDELLARARGLIAARG